MKKIISSVFIVMHLLVLGQGQWEEKWRIPSDIFTVLVFIFYLALQIILLIALSRNPWCFALPFVKPDLLALVPQIHSATTTLPIFCNAHPSVIIPLRTKVLIGLYWPTYEHNHICVLFNRT